MTTTAEPDQGVVRLAAAERTVSRADVPVLVFLATLFTARWMLSRWNSYWFDELLSVLVYGHWHDTSMEALRNLAEHSVHPPLYQFVLYQWINVFGDTETATRSLSNLYITLAAVCVYLLVRDLWGRRVGVLATVGFSLMYAPTYYALETRSYAQTMFLVALSSYLLLRLARAVGDEPRLRAVQVWAPLVLLVGANTALLMTHYYNLFWLAGQAVFVVVWGMREWPARRWPTWGLASLGLLYVLPGVLFYVAWGGVLRRQLGEWSGGYEIEDDSPAHGIVGLLRELVLDGNLRTPTVVGWMLAAVVAGVVGAAVVAIMRRGPREQRETSWGTLYLAVWMLLPLVIVWAAFVALGVERYSPRYFLFAVVPLAPLLAVALDRVVTAAWRTDRPGRTVVSTAVIGLLFAAWVLPGGYDGATERKNDWRGIATQINDMVRADEDHTYILYETTTYILHDTPHRGRPMSDFYFDRLPGSFGPYSTLTRAEEELGEYPLLDEHRDHVEEHDRLVLSFPHSRTIHFPNALAELEERYTVVYRQLDHMGRGYIVYDVTGN